MKKFYSISIHGDFANVLYMEKKKSIFHILEEQVLDLAELPKFLQNKRIFYIVIDAEEALDDVITVPSVIKSSNVLKSYILKRFKDSLPSKNILLNFNKLSEDKEESTITYKVDAIDQKSYIKKLELIPNWKEIQSATIEKFAFLSLTRKCFDNVKGYGYFSVYTHGNVVTVLAIDERGDLLFERSSTTLTNEEASQYLNMVEEINQTIAYVKQQFRSTEFSTLVIAGSLALDDKAAEHLLFSTDLNIAVMYPNTFIKGLENEEPQHYIITIGAFLVHKKDRFLPQKVYSLKEYDFAIKALLVLSGCTLLVSSYFAYEKYDSYTQALDRYDNIKDRLIRMIKTTNTYPMHELEKSYKHLQIAEKFLRYHPTDFLLQLKPLIEMLPPKKYDFSDDNTQKAKFHIQFRKTFQTLGELYAFKQEFFNKFQIINDKKTLKLEEKTNYTNLEFAVDISNNVVQKKVTPRRRRRR